MSTRIIALAAGKGKRMNSKLPKVLHGIAGKSMLKHVLDTAGPLTEKAPIVVHGLDGDLLKSAICRSDIDWVLQAEQLGTGHAVRQTIHLLDDSDLALILCADMPLIRTASLRKLIDRANEESFSILTVVPDNPFGYGRVLRNSQGYIDRIVETFDLKDSQTSVTECNTGIFALRASMLKRWLPQLNKNNAQSEFYLTDCVTLASSEGVNVSPILVSDPKEGMGVNNKKQLAFAERVYQRQLAEELMEAGVTLVDPDRVDVRGSLVCGKDVTIDVNVIFEGDVNIGDGVYVGPNNVIKDSDILENSTIKANCVLESVFVGSESKVGPFSRLRSGTALSEKTVVGNFVEIKKASIGEGSKVNHLSYIGDAELGSNVNIGAGTITCNFDGANKHKTVLEDDVFVGSNSELVAPVRVGAGSTVGAGTTVTKDVEGEQLVVSRVSQKHIPGWRRPSKDGSDSSLPNATQNKTRK